MFAKSLVAFSVVAFALTACGDEEETPTFGLVGVTVAPSSFTPGEQLTFTVTTKKAVGGVAIEGPFTGIPALTDDGTGKVWSGVGDTLATATGSGTPRVKLTSGDPETPATGDKSTSYYVLPDKDPDHFFFVNYIYKGVWESDGVGAVSGAVAPTVTAE